mmetsp:Transcript_49021/g.106769  ORF Transcript_49021/g.106769 Transcript_49021/m.106769 type:complete len:107 (-) Transcript_49021:64-384(-)
MFKALLAGLAAGSLRGHAETESTPWRRLEWDQMKAVALEGDQIRRLSRDTASLVASAVKNKGPTAEAEQAEAADKYLDVQGLMLSSAVHYEEGREAQEASARPHHR